MGGGEVAAIGQLTSALENNEASRVTSNLHCIIAYIYIYILIVYIETVLLIEEDLERFF